jgi:hypothetical protein
MGPQTSYSWKVRVAGTAFAATACLLLLPAHVQAGCGDYPMLVHTERGAMSHSSSNLSEANPSASPASQAPKTKLPCSGPNCSRQSDHLPAAPVLITSSTAEHWLWLAALPLVPDFDNGTYLGDLPSLHPIFRSSLIEHPPRLPSSHSL